MQIEKQNSLNYGVVLPSPVIVVPIPLLCVITFLVNKANQCLRSTRLQFRHHCHHLQTNATEVGNANHRATYFRVFQVFQESAMRTVFAWRRNVHTVSPTKLSGNTVIGSWRHRSVRDVSPLTRNNSIYSSGHSACLTVGCKLSQLCSFRK